MKLFTITENDANQRLDKFLTKLLPNATKSLIYKFNRKDKVKIKFDGSEGKFKKRDNEYKIQIWDEIRVFLTDKEFESLQEIRKPVEIIEKWEKFDKNDIVFEDSIEISKMKRKPTDLVSYLYKECSFKYGSLLMTGTGIVPTSAFTLQSKDKIEISIENIGTLINYVS